MTDLLTKEEVANLLKISPRSVSRWVREGRLRPPVHLTPRVIRFRKEDVELAIEEATIGESAPRSKTVV